MRGQCGPRGGATLEVLPMPAEHDGQDEMEARLDFLLVKLHVRGPARWVFAITLLVVIAILVLKLTGHGG
jgi:hypothetical protein